MEDEQPTLTPLPSVEQVGALIRHRRTIKPGDMSDSPVTESDILALLENANWAPTHGLTEPWRFRIFRGDSRVRLAEALSSIYAAETPKENYLESKFTKLSTTPLKAPVCIVVWMKRQDIRKIPEIEEIESVACAVHNMHLTASAMGMAAFWSSPKVVYTRKMNEWLKIDSADKCLGVFYLGWPKDGLDWPSGQRRPIADKVEWADR